MVYIWYLISKLNESFGGSTGTLHVNSYKCDWRLKKFINNNFVNKLKIFKISETEKLRVPITGIKKLINLI